ncbi:TerD family protein [Nocardioides yefusunii]|uniref:TerD family protein n=1 Tax=Nocardioides yefusunii TaxID=2500546 RepID=A0ABW1R1Z0_9ACTN|nr:TerD family protein [Nocardioides yefusunii]
MPVSLSKGGNVSLTKLAPTLANITVGLGWDARTTTGTEFDLDASALVCREDGKVVSDQHFVFYNQTATPDGAVRHSGDVRDGAVDGDDESIEVDLNALGAEVAKIVVAVTIHEGESRGQSFGQVRNAYVRVVNRDNNEELARYDLSEDASLETAMLFGEVYRHGAEWKFRAVGQGYASGLVGIVTDHGVRLG